MGRARRTTDQRVCTGGCPADEAVTCCIGRQSPQNRRNFSEYVPVQAKVLDAHLAMILVRNARPMASLTEWKPVHGRLWGRFYRRSAMFKFPKRRATGDVRPKLRVDAELLAHGPDLAQRMGKWPTFIVILYMVSCRTALLALALYMGHGFLISSPHILSAVRPLLPF